MASQRPEPAASACPARFPALPAVLDTTRETVYVVGGEGMRFQAESGRGPSSGRKRNFLSSEWCFFTLIPQVSLSLHVLNKEVGHVQVTGAF